MLKIKVIADNILNLTDARYFAAYGVDYLVFDIEKIAPQSIREIKEWIEGVKIFLDAEGQVTPAMLDLIINLSPNGFVSGSEALLDDLNSQFSELEFFLRQADGTLTNHIDKDELPYKKISTTESIESLITSDKISGIIVEGEPEEKVGFKNFDQLDKIFELIAI